VQRVKEGSPAERAGIREQDVIIKIGDRMVRNAAELTVAERLHEPGDVVPVKLVREGRELVVDVKLGAD
jgi:S1-C subfamily serine protease